jgi:osmotically-inducible protein OsmY
MNRISTGLLDQSKSRAQAKRDAEAKRVNDAQIANRAQLTAIQQAKEDRTMQDRSKFNLLLNGGEYQMPEDQTFPGEAPIEGLQQKGYLQGDMGQEATRQFAAQIAGLEGMGGAGVGLLGRINSDQAALDQAGIDAQADIDARRGPFDNMKDYWQAQRELTKDYAKEAGPYRRVVKSYGAVTDIVKERGGFDKLTGADDVALIKFFVKSVTPKESVMSDDVRQIVNASGLPGTIDSYLQAFAGKGQLGKEQRRQIYATMTGLFNSSKIELDDIRTQYDPQVAAGEFDPEQVYRPLKMPEPFGYEAPNPAPLLLQPPNEDNAPWDVNPETGQRINQEGVNEFMRLLEETERANRK